MPCGGHVYLYLLPADADAKRFIFNGGYDLHS
jgi:hypothetical protein